MQVILKENIGKLGKVGDLVNVKSGFARNFLFPQDKALRATKENKDVSLEVVGLVFEGQFFSAEKYKELADLPSKEVLLSKLLSGLAHPMTNLAGTLNGAMSKLAMTLLSLKETKS